NAEDNSGDVSAYEKLHVDLWVPQASKMNIKIEGPSFQNSISFTLNEGWNTIDCDPAWWNKEDATYDWKDLKYIIFENYKLDDGETSAEGKPFAFTNVYFWKTPEVKLPEVNPTVPTLAEGGVLALFSGKYKINTLNFVPKSWGTQNWILANEGTDTEYYYAADFRWDGCGEDVENPGNFELPVTYDTFHADIYVTVDANLKFTIEALGTADGGTGWKNGLVVEGLKANQWNSVTIDLLNAPFIDYQFKDMRYLILEGFTAEGTPLGIANAYFYDSATVGVENVENNESTIKKYIKDGQIVIERDNKLYNVLGVEL
ncbi:MAG: hypothetical protein IJS05_00920, partial [Paludibacteraceae bacterium]|nr:hypothetical protein [Paludibacteraceae bacterium]